MVDDVAGAGPGRVRGGTDGVPACACGAEAGISCVVAAPSKIRPAADRVKTDRSDAERLARLLRLGEIPSVRVPGSEEEAARDLVRAREDARGDLMRARHRLSKLLLRHGAVYDATAWILFFRFGEDKEGERWLFLALQADPTYRPAHEALAAYYQRTGRPELAENHRRLAQPDGVSLTRP